MKEKIVVDHNKCLKCGMCASIAQDTFTFGENGEIKVIKNEVTDEVKNAINSCPVGAITTEKK